MMILLYVFILMVSSSEAVKREWASEVLAFSSEYSSTSYSAKQILGKPNVYPKYGASSKAWTQGYGQTNAKQYVELKFPEKIWLAHVNIYEVYNAGAVTRILAKNGEHGWVEIARAPYAHLIKRARIFSPEIKRVDFPVNELRIEVDCTVSRSYVYIDAVEIVGGGCPRGFRKLWDSCYLIRKARVSADTAFVNCLNAGGYLANFETLEEALRMKKKLEGMHTSTSFYVGGRNINRRKPGGDWRWIKHGQVTKMAYYAFGAREPNGSDRSPQDCMFFYSGEGFAFHSVPCRSARSDGGYICEA
ncbi:uncharacterized protein LOC134258201 isoform X3 [Saccostrea cucullata]|uniref:uncharacterized protein LOC134258201 isoform X3 n=1 Tax=Saccostrea cuccullata TaxID=36930 RepID=UPI002ED3030E